MSPPPRATQVLTWIAALGGPAVLTAMLVPVGASQKRDYVFLYLGLVAVLGVLRGLWPALVAAAVSFLLVDYFFVPPVGTVTIADEQDVVNLLAFAASATPAFQLGGVVIDLGRRSVVKDGKEVRLSPTEYGLLSYLARHAGTVIDHRTLLREVWGPSHVHERNYLWTFVRRLRQKLEDDPQDPRLIVSAGSRGYRLGLPASRQGMTSEDR